MIVHRIGQDTHIDYDWTDDEDEPITVEEAVITVYDRDEEVIEDVIDLTINGDYPVSLHVPADSDLVPGNYDYELIAVDDATGDATILSGGLLRVKGRSVGS
jgi:hypothetical protein